MKLPIRALTTALCAAWLGHCPAHAEQGVRIGPFVDLTAGATTAAFGDIGQASGASSDQSASGFKLGAGYWFSEHWGVHVHGIRSGTIERKYAAGTYRADIESYGVSLLGRLPINERWAVIGKVTLDHVDASERKPAAGVAGFEKLSGRSTNLVLPGVEIDYRLSDSLDLIFEAEGRGNAGKELAVGYLGLGLRFSF
ncbi:MAG: hypothetical protein R3E87_00115 [Burkholderiaceae bacterium]